MTMAVLVTNESGSDYRISGHSNQKLIPAGVTVLLSDAEWDTVITGKRGPGQLNPLPLPVDATVTAEPGPPYALALLLDDTEAGGISYVGEALPGAATSAASWRVKRLTETGPDVAVQWADGNGNFDNVWDDRASLSYS
jgi:hypothetical protein